MSEKQVFPFSGLPVYDKLSLSRHYFVTHTGKVFPMTHETFSGNWSLVGHVIPLWSAHEMIQLEVAKRNPSPRVSEYAPQSPLSQLLRVFGVKDGEQTGNGCTLRFSKAIRLCDVVDFVNSLTARFVVVSSYSFKPLRSSLTVTPTSPGKVLLGKSAAASSSAAESAAAESAAAESSSSASASVAPDPLACQSSGVEKKKTPRRKRQDVLSDGLSKFFQPLTSRRRQ